MHSVVNLFDRLYYNTIKVSCKMCLQSYEYINAGTVFLVLCRTGHRPLEGSAYTVELALQKF